jgi:hypothetical protein
MPVTWAIMVLSAAACCSLFFSYYWAGKYMDSPYVDDVDFAMGIDCDSCCTGSGGVELLVVAMRE